LKELPSANHLLPQPASVKPAEGAFPLAPDFSFHIVGPHSARLESAANRSVRELRTRAGFTPVAAAPNAAFTIQIHAASPAVLTAEEDESYRLHVTSTGISLDAPTDIGAMRGLQTLVQWVQPSQGQFMLPAVEIDDSPRFRWRGLLVDCSRHFEPVPVIKRTLDAMEAVKLNVFHWHLADDQGVRVESKVFPKLTGVGSDGLFYTQQQIREIVAYASDRGIRVIPEFEMPGHSTAWLYAYPELSSGAPPTGIRREFGVAPYAMDPTCEETYQFLDRFLTEMVTLFPDAYVHIGGDETTAPDWKTSPRIQAFMQSHSLKDSAALQAYFNQRILKILTRLHRHMIGWDEIFNPALPKDIVIQIWRGEASMSASTGEGYQGILSAGYYLDGMQSAEQHYRVDPAPSDAKLTPQQRSLIRGGEVAMWGEFVNEQTIDSRIWSRAAAIAERLWSPESTRDVDDLYRRLDALSVQLEALGVQHIAHEDATLRALAGTEDIAALKTFSSVLQPASFHDRFGRGKATQSDPLDHLSDAVRPDPPARREFDRLAKAFLQSPQGSSVEQHALETLFRALADCAPAVLNQVKATPVLQEAQTRAEQLPALAELGSQAVDALAKNTAKSAEWRSHALAVIAEAAKPSANVRFVFLEPLKSLVMAVKQ
jgi:hexosaminidase